MALFDAVAGIYAPAAEFSRSTSFFVPIIIGRQTRTPVGGREPMSATTEFKSYVPVAQRAALERLVFFNSCQGRVSDCIANAIEKFGAPEIVADRDRLRIYMKGMPDVQSLFALDATRGARSV